MTSLTVITLVVIIYGVRNRRGYGRALGLGGATPAGAAFALSATTVIPTFYATALGAAGALLLRLLGNGARPRMPRLRLPPGGPLMVLFVVWSIFVTVVSPVLFAGTKVLSPQGKEILLVPGVLGSTNTSQMIYLALAGCIVVFLGRSPSAGPEIIGLAVGLTVALSLWRYTNQLVGVPFPEKLFDNSPAFNYIESAPGGAVRFRGILPEPSGLAISCLVCIAYMLPRMIHLRGWRRAGTVVLVAGAAYMGVISTSTTFIVAGVLISVMALFIFLFRFVIKRTSLAVPASVLACVLIIASLWLVPIAAAFVQSAVDDKVSSSSYTDRSGSDTVAYDNFFDTWGFGVGVGSTRPSSFFPGILAATGLIGTLLFAALVVRLLTRAVAVPEFRPVVWAFLAAMIVKIVSSPDLSDSSGVFWMSIGLLSRAAAIAAERAAQPDPPPPSSSPVTAPAIEGSDP